MSFQIIKRRKIMPPGAVPSESKERMDRSYHSATLPERRSKSAGPPTSVIHLKKPEKEGFGFSMAFRLYVKDVKRKGVAHYGGLQRDHVIQKVRVQFSSLYHHLCEHRHYHDASKSL